MKVTLHKFLFILFFFSASFQTTHSQTTSADTTKVSAYDSLDRKFIQPIPFVGTLDRSLPSENIVTDSAINFSNYRYAGDLISLFPGILIRDFGSLGLLPDITVDGVGGREISILSDGVRLNDPLTGLFNPYLYPTENIERVEVVQGTRAFLYGLNSTGGAINFISKSKKAVHAYSRLRYSESGYGFGIVDGMVSQDVLRGMNVTLGAQHTVYGERFQNENYDCWNARIKVRYNIDNNINVFASEMYNQTLLGQYGGVDISNTPASLWFQSLQAIVRNTDAYEKIARHDFQLGAAARMLPDSNDISTMTLFFTSNVRGYRDLENRQPSNGIFIDQFQHTRWFGMKFTQHLTVTDQEMDFGTEIQSERVHLTPATKESSATSISIFGKSEIPISEILKLSPYGRFDNYKGQHLLSYGGDAAFSILKNIQFFGGYSRSYRIPTFQERIGTDTLLSSSLTDNLPERHHLFEVGIRLSNQEWYSFQLRSFHRTIWNLITVGPQSKVQLKSPYEFTRHQKKIIQGVAGTASIRFGSFYAEGEAQFLEMIDHDDEQLTFPKWSATGGIYFWDKLLNNHLDLKAGVCGRAYSSYLGKEFNQQAQVYLPGKQLYNIEQTGVIDLVILLHIGKAYIHFIWDNLLNRQYIMANFYPMPERQMRFGVSWEFLD